METTPDLVRYLRKRANLTQKQLAAVTGIAHTDICNIERGRREIFPSWETRIGQALANALGIAL